MELAATWLPWIPVGLVVGAAVLAVRAPSPRADFRDFVVLGANWASYGAFLGVFFAALTRGTVFNLHLEITDIVFGGAAVGGGIGAFIGVALHLRGVAQVIKAVAVPSALAWATICWWSFAVPIAIPFTAELLSTVVRRGVLTAVNA